MMEGKMSNELELKQTIKQGDGNIQIGVQHNYGLTVTQVSEMAFEIFRQYYPKLQDELLKKLRIEVEEILGKIPAERIVPPNARITVPALQNASITEEDNVRVLYARLLANSMDKVAKDGVHPAFIEIIKQLNSDEAKLLPYLYYNQKIPVITVRATNEKREGVDELKNFSLAGFQCGCEIPLNIATYFDNFVRLGVLVKQTFSSLVNKDLYSPLKEYDYIQNIIKRIESRPDEYIIPDFEESYYEITNFGRAFCESCVIDIIHITVNNG